MTTGEQGGGHTETVKSILELYSDNYKRLADFHIMEWGDKRNLAMQYMIAAINMDHDLFRSKLDIAYPGISLDADYPKDSAEAGKQNTKVFFVNLSELCQGKYQDSEAERGFREVWHHVERVSPGESKPRLANYFQSEFKEYFKANHNALYNAAKRELSSPSATNTGVANTNIGPLTSAVNNNSRQTDIAR